MKSTPNDNQGEYQPPPLVREMPSFYLFAESNPNPILITDSKGDIQYVNAAWESLTGYTSAEALGQNPSFLNSGKTPPALYKEVWGALRSGKSFESEEFIDRKKDGSEFSIRSVFFPIQIRGVVTYLVQMFGDISERKGLEKEKGAFISIASHELRSPLSVIMLSLDLLAHEIGDASGPIADILATLRGETERMALLLNDLLDVSKIQAGKLQTQKEEHDLEQLVQHVVGELGTAHTTHSFSIERHGSTKLKVLGDKSRITQVLTNLLSNAVKYSPEGNRIVVALNAAPHEVEVSVQDFGIGIGEEEQQKIFDMFYRAKNRGRIEGTGLGLFIAAQIIAAHGGRLWVTSKEGSGSTFHFSLPLVQSPQPLQA